MRGPGKGVSNNPAGKPKGTKNKINTEVKERLEVVVLSNIDVVMKEFESLKGERKLKFFIELVKLILPRPKDSEEEEAIDRRNNDLLERLFPRND